MPAGMHASIAASRWIRVWNAPLRVFHWCLVAAYLVAWSTLGSRHLDIHVFAGYVMIGLVGFRLIWGVLGGPYARFRDFCFTWGEVVEHLRGVLQHRAQRFIGHNPAGSWIIYLLLGLSGVVGITGLLTLGGEEQHGPLAGIFTFAQGERFHRLHELTAWLTLAVIAVHLTGVLMESLLQRENLVRSMISGFKAAPADAASAPAHTGTAMAMVLVIALFGGYWFGGYLAATPDDPYLPFVGPELADDPLWREECGSCHLAFHPGLLPARSWRKMLKQQQNHFGEDLFLDAETITRLEHFAVANAAEQGNTEAAWKINRSIPERETPLKITETIYWKRKHRELPEAVWRHESVNGRSNCAACHKDAGRGTFEDAAMSLPKGF